MKIPGYITVAEAAERIGLSHGQTCNLIRQNRIVAEKIGCQWFVKVGALKKFHRLPCGNPNWRKRQTA